MTQPSDDTVDPGTDVTATDTSNPPGPDAQTPRDVLPVDAMPGSCGVTPAVAAHVTAMSTTGWTALNRTRNMMMHGCSGASRPQDCLASAPLADATNIGANRSAIPAARLRILYSSTNASSYWTRSSADGRFVARGTRIADLARNVEVRATNAAYDPAFFPDNAGLLYHSSMAPFLCPMTVLTTGTPTAFDITASPCTSAGGVGLYEHLGTSLAGGDYWATSAGAAAWDDGGHSPTLTETPTNESTGWTANARMGLSLWANTGSGFTVVNSRPLQVATPYQGDGVISPSGQLVITRFVDPMSTRRYGGFVLHRLEATRSGSTVNATLTEIARYCQAGAKPAFSLDERWAITHHYVGGGATANADAMERGFTGSSDPNWTGAGHYATQGAADVYLIDLATGNRIRVTNMGPGQYALYPHFRSDGWIYFIVRTLGSQAEQIVASDAALVM